MKKITVKPKSMRWRMIFIMLICWMVPFALLIGIFGAYVAGNHENRTAENFSEQLKFNNTVCTERLNYAVASSRQASYDGEILKAYSQYIQNDLTAVNAGKQYKAYLTSKYQKNDAIADAILFMHSDKDTLYSVYNTYANGSYQLTKEYETNYHKEVKQYADRLGTSVGFLYLGKNLYVVRNLVDSRFKVRGTLLLGLNMDYCFGSIAEYPLSEGAYVYVNGQEIILEGNESLKELVQGERLPNNSYLWEKGRLYVASEANGDTYTLNTYMILDRQITRYPFYGYQYLLGAMLISLVPMLLLMMWVFRRQVTNPVTVISEGAKHIKNGEVGYQIEMPAVNSEFTYLKESFNEMSSNLKRQYDRIYEEEVALREARIMALQSHINPHFMNNTLEIINWEARLGGNEKVSKMIESLSIMLDAAMDRKKTPEVTLREEMSYVNAYLHIMKERLGERLSMEISIDESYLDYPVPRLILQPVIENAIEHGVVMYSSGLVSLIAERDEKYLYLKVYNSGVLTEEDKKRIKRLLDPAYISSKEPSGNLGIANVNQRLRILFGDPCGLRITETAEGRVLAILTIPIRTKNDNSCEDDQ